ncbi:DNA-directed DNA polymerase, family A, palm domain containing protein [uncultured Caudovirales phage]|uniref:DNA-directed DNA polymerase, family A, palm domain containing protein n=1 Tax=uncultured Caudovirales phage TaxID=2100421 RepID=A0A6J5RMW2_9CAUD|nr:DNA-directed DNA polymerase, family A, palm domain containing protein [uncultured Caudovirales phage]
MRLKPAPAPELKILFLDTETFSDVPLKRGHHAYFAGESEIMVAQWAVNDGPVVVEDLVRIRGDGEVEILDPSDELLEHIFDADEVVIHNSPFDRTGIRKLWGIDIELERTHDTMARAMAHSLPGSLGKLCDIMGVPAEQSKDKRGGELIRLFTMPRPKNTKLRRATKRTHPGEWLEFLDYAGADIPPMRELYKRLPRWNYRDTNTHQELSLWRLDQRVNERGFRVDTHLAQRALETINREQARLADETKLLTGGERGEDGLVTGGEVSKATKRDDMLVHIFVEYGVYLPDMKKDTLERKLDDPELPDALKQLLRVRLATSTTSTAKYTAVQRVCVEEAEGVDVVRGSLAFCGAIRTGRWAGRLFQPHNLPRPDMKPHEITAAIEALQANCLDLVTSEVMKALSNMLRGLIIARPGRKLVAADLEQIESRAAAWLAGEQWKLDKIAEYDVILGYDKKGKPIHAGHDNYVWAYAEAFGVSPEAVEEDKKRNGFWRQVGKVMELAQGYEGGVGAWLAFAMVYRLKLDELAKDAYPKLPRAAREQAEIIWDWRNKKELSTFGLSRKVFVVIEAFKNLWRAAHPAISSYWGDLDNAAKEAVRYPGYEIECRALAFEKKGTWLRMILPSGRVLCYPSPQIKRVKGKEQLTYMGVNQFSRKWNRIPTYGGKLFENATQATARDVMGHNMPDIEDAGFNILLTVHDEVITEAPQDDELTPDLLSAILAKNPPWLRGCPLAAGGFEAQRYRKD